MTVDRFSGTYRFSEYFEKIFIVFIVHGTVLYKDMCTPVYTVTIFPNTLYPCLSSCPPFPVALFVLERVLFPLLCHKDIGDFIYL